MELCAIQSANKTETKTKKKIISTKNVNIIDGSWNCGIVKL